MEAIVDKELIRKSLKEMAVSEPEFVSTLMAEVADVLKETKRQKLERIVAQDFAEYETVFRKLA
ncbi:hypothetical protein J2I47_12245 [Fibrella sp. HMF5335]|uniref:Uncharacterized protein n=1 Tax=Fibrella rubiginis TaxID=2817060 RepID=A0A939GGF5_9BACT|nr:hypothetical protein [Fibrella rubiginis]MBO0937318.1 hypothetical protein [Fibrella rubiginis]